jgi:hypothetical protein
MTIWWLIVILGFIGASGIAFIWIIVTMSKFAKKDEDGKNLSDSLEQAAREDVDHIFSEDFREELRNRGRLHFEKIIGENAMFLQQDLRLTTSQLNEYMKAEIVSRLKQEFSKYEQSISDATQSAIESIKKTNEAVENERGVMAAQIKEEVEKAKTARLEHFENNMSDIVNHYILDAVGQQIDLSDQLEYIISDIETNKQAILEDIKNGT